MTVVLWPVAAGLGFLAAIGLVIALGRASTASYELERSRPAGSLPGGVTSSPSGGAFLGR